PRLVPSWHGFLHTAIVRRFPTAGLIPENPFFAGEPLKYYWFFHWMGAGVSSVFGVDPLTALRILVLAGLVLVTVAAGLVGRKVYGSLGAGLVIGVFALAGANPLGPVIAMGRHLVQHRQLLEPTVHSAELQTVHVSDDLADDLMSRPLLPAMYLSADWRNGQNIVWFADISSRGLALGVMMLMLYFLLAPRAGPVSLSGTAITAALLTALNPIVGLAACFLLAGSVSALWLFHRWWGADPGPIAPALGRSAALALGALAALPTYYHLFGQGGSGRISPVDLLGLKLVVIAANFLILLPLTALGIKAYRGASAPGLQAIALAGVLLLGLVPLIQLEKGNEHNLANAAYVLLAVPAVAWLVRDINGTSRLQKVQTSRLLLAALVCLPMTVATWIAFHGRPPLPFLAQAGVLKRMPQNDPVAQLYQWIGSNTDRDAVFVVDPSDVVKMSGNVSELPAFTGRAIFTDQPSYMTTPYPDADRRTAIAGKLVHGEELTFDEAGYVRGLGRPVYVITWHADDSALLGRLNGRYGSPVFSAGFVAVFGLRP
ncbi:MAG TPA: DUF2298 domain-containing protein, partial [Gemmatimonadales bacterium]|nr:DUF2298 domain-containing protein [Gemmatimonadales bacterium]